MSDTYRERFRSSPHLYFSPGRINFIGEHIDYNDGFVMPSAIDKGICYAVGLNDTGRLNIHSIDFSDSASLPVKDVHKMSGWKNYVLSVVNEFLKKGLEVKGFDCVFGGDIPNGAGISSSAAVEGGLAFAINELCGFGLGRKELALLCQSAEHGYPGVMCGIMDQYANMFGKKDHVILLDTRSVSHEYFPLHLEGYSILLMNTNVHHSLASSEYNVRRKQCEEGLEILKKEMGIHSFRDIKDAKELLPFQKKLEEKIYDRCRFVVEEILRTQAAARLLQQNDLAAFGRLMYETHDGLSRLYEVSCPELDFLVMLAKENAGIIGARMMGGGFGGCTINIIRQESVDDFVEKAAGAYQKKFQLDPTVIRVSVEDGTHAL